MYSVDGMPSSALVNIMTGNHLRTRTQHQRIHVVIYGTTYEGRRGDPRTNIHMSLGQLSSQLTVSFDSIHAMAPIGLRAKVGCRTCILVVDVPHMM